MIKILKCSWKLLLVVVAIVALMLAVNARDEELKPEVVAFMGLQKSRFSDNDNAYFAMVGMNVAEGQDPHAAGKRTIAEYESQFSKDPLLGAFKEPQAQGGARLVAKGRMREICDAATCSLSRFSTKEPELKRMLADNQALLERYRRLYSYPHFEEAATPSVAAPGPNYSGVGVTLLLGDIALMVKRGEIARALEALELDILFWRRVLSESRELRSKSAASLTLYRDYRLLSEIMVSQAGVPKAHYERLARMTAPLDAGALDFSEAIRREWMWGVQNLNRIYAEMRKEPLTSSQGTLEWTMPNWLWPFFKINATINQDYAAVKRDAELAATPASGFAKEREATRSRLESEFDFRQSLGWRTIYNPVGKFMNSTFGKFDSSDYVARLHDIDGYVRLIALQAQIGNKGLTDAEISGFLQAVDKRYSDPYTDQPMQWDAAMHSLFFKGFDKRINTSGYVRVPIH